MATHENGIGLVDEDVTGAQQPRFTLHPLHEAALRLADFGPGRPSSKTKDLIGMLLGHGARAWRQSQAPVAIHLHISTPERRRPVAIKLR